MWQTVDYKGNAIKWYEAELIEKLKVECMKVLDIYWIKKYKPDDEKYIQGCASLAKIVLEHLKSYEAEK